MTTPTLDETVTPNPAASRRREPRTRRGAWGAATGGLGAVAGVLPHVLHHVGPLVGAAVLTGAAGTVSFGLAGLVLSIPMLLGLRRRFGTWWAPTLGLLTFTTLFLVSSLVVGPLISGANDPGSDGGSKIEHRAHHD
jgi:hypothetical protein